MSLCSLKRNTLTQRLSSSHLSTQDKIQGTERLASRKQLRLGMMDREVGQSVELIPAAPEFQPPSRGQEERTRSEAVQRGPGNVV